MPQATITIRRAVRSSSSSISPEVAEVDPDPARGALADRLGDRVRLLVDLLEHERLEALLLGGLRVPVDLHDLALERIAGRAHELDAVRPQHHELVVVDVLNSARVAQERGDRRGQELLAIAPPDDQRALLARADQQPGLIGAHRHERVVAAQLLVGVPDRLDQVPPVVLGDQVRDHLRVGLRGEHRAVLDQLVLEGDVVLDDPVDDHVNTVGGVEMGMRVLLADAPMGRPARVADPGPGAGRRWATARRARSGLSAARRRSRLPTARTASIRSPLSTEMPALS